MGLFDHDSYSEHEWEDSWETLWNEHDWERYLRDEEDEIRKYRTLYSKLIRSQNRLDEVALFMGWEATTPDEEEADEPLTDATPEQPYTIHKHPLFIASKALHGWLSERLFQYVSLSANQISGPDGLRLQAAINESDYYSLMGVSALDLGDYTLAVAYFKRGLATINRCLSLLNRLEEQRIDALKTYVHLARARLFDLREIWLRVIADCRSAVANQPPEEE